MLARTMNERTNGRTYELMDDRRKERTKGGMNDRSKERMNKPDNFVYLQAKRAQYKEIATKCLFTT